MAGVAALLRSSFAWCERSYEGRARPGREKRMNKEIELRRMDVERLANEGSSQEEIADVLGVSLRTVERDMEAIRAARVLARDEKLVAGQVIKLIARAEGMIGALKKVAGRSGASDEMKIAAELAAWKVAKELAQELRAMGYLPNAAREVRASLTHRVEKTASLIEASARVVEFEKILTEAGRMDDKARAEIAALKGEIVKEAVGSEAGE